MGQWFFVLPLPLREAALNQRKTEGYSKLWDKISDLNQKFGYRHCGHVEKIIGDNRSYLTQFISRFEVLPNQTGAMFFLDDQLVGLEIAPNVKYFRELWLALLGFSYGSAAFFWERQH